MTHLLTGAPLPADLLALPAWAPFTYVAPMNLPAQDLSQVQVFVDVLPEEDPTRLKVLAQLPPTAVVLLGVIGTSLYALWTGQAPPRQRVYGFCPLPYFVQRDTWEISQLAPEQPLADDLAWLGRGLLAVPDQVGLVGPRVVARIVNEAYFALGEGVASAEDLDLAVRLGVNYPQGPLAWGQAIGLPAVVRLLQALQTIGGAESYQVAPALHRAAAQAVHAS